MNSSNRQEKSNPLKRLANSALGSFGYQISRKNATERTQNYSDDFLKLVYENPYSEFTMLSLPNLYALFNTIKYVVKNKIPGDIVECGVWRGGAMMFAANTLLHFGDIERTIWLYDTYSGMTKPTEKDIDCNGVHAQIAMSEKESTNDFVDWCYADISDVQKNLSSTGYPMEKIKFIKGDVLETIPAQNPEKICILRLDTDWYESTAHEMQYLYPNISEKGILIIDDYGTWSGSKQAVDEYFEGKNVLFHRVDHTAIVIVK